MKKVYEAKIVYHIDYIKKHWLKGIYEHFWELSIPVEKYILAFSEENARNTVVYLSPVDNDIVKEIVKEKLKVTDFTIRSKSIEIKEIPTDNWVSLKLNMSNEDFDELLRQEMGYA